MPVTHVARRQLLLVFLLVTVAMVVLDLAGSTWPGRARALAATAVGPVQRAVAAVDRGDGASLAQENAVLRTQLALAQAQLSQDRATGRLLQSPSAVAGHLLPARVVGANSTVLGGRQVTLDVGQRDGVQPNVTVVSADGLVGRVISVGQWSCDVRLLGGTDATVAVRVGVSGYLGTVAAATPPDVPQRARGDLTLTVVDLATVNVGDQVITLGSPGGRPYVPGLLIGTVVGVDPPHGSVTGTAVVRPAVQASRLDVVGVVVTSAVPPATPAAAAPSLPGS